MHASLPGHSSSLLHPSTEKNIFVSNFKHSRPISGEGRSACLTWEAMNEWVSVEPLLTFAADRVVVRNAVGVFAARVLGTGVYANSVETIAELMRRTVFVVLANRLVREYCKRKMRQRKIVKCVNSGEKSVARYSPGRQPTNPLPW